MWRHWWRRDWGKIALIWLAWQATLLLAAFLVTRFEPLGYQPSYALAETLSDSGLPAAIWRLGGFDGVHYLTIVRHHSYREIGGIQAFFPLYPLLIATLNFLTGQSLVSGLLISSVSLYGFLYLSFRLVAECTNRRTAWWFLALTLVWPASFFYLTVYTESLFLCLLVATFYAYKHQKYPLVALLGALLSACRIVGIIAIGALILDYLARARRRRQPPAWRALVTIAAGSTGLIAWMIYLGVTFGDPLLFASVQSSWGGGRDATHLTLLPQVFWRYTKMLATGFSSLHETYYILQELLVALMSSAALLLASWRVWQRRDPDHPLFLLLFSWGAYLLPTLTGNFSSLPRYALACLSVTWLGAKLLPQKRRLSITFCLIFYLIQILNLALFLEGFWVS